LKRGVVLLDVTNSAPPPDRPTNTFIALRPPWQIAEQFYSRATQLCSDARIAGSQRPSAILHMTILPICRYSGRLPRAALEAIDDAISMVRFPAIEIALDEARSFETRKDRVPFVLEGDELADVCALRLATLGALRVKGFHIPAPTTYSPHMTIAYAHRRSPRMKVEPFSWKVREFQLIESWVGQTKYVELGRWTLWDHEPPRLETRPQLG
jgi:2'-5' RNA ligase